MQGHVTNKQLLGTARMFLLVSVKPDIPVKGSPCIYLYDCHEKIAMSLFQHSLFQEELGGTMDHFVSN
jgi:hypothetical protein